MAREESRGKRPFKVWDVWRSLRKSLVVNTLKELEFRGKEKLGIPAVEPVRLVLESDGTQVEDGEYFRTLPNNTVILILRQGERWYPVGVDVIKTAISAIPKIVCETIHALELQDETPSWKIMDNKGRVTVVLHWDQRSSRGEGTAPPSGTTTPKKQPSLIIQTGADPGPSSRSDHPPRITIINHDDIEAGSYSHSRLTKQGSSIESANIHVHTPECAHHAHQPTASRAGSPVNGNGLNECDFHCCALHEEGRKIAVHKSVATSPIQDSLSTSPQQHPSSMSDPSKRGSSYSKGHVRFLDIEGCSPMTHQQPLEHESSESETETTVMEDESLTSEKFLLLVDQLTVDVKKHLSIKDIGIILERLSSKIIDVERLDRETESDEVHNWTIKATIRGEVLRELGVIYNGNYYAISEHPGYREESEETRDDNEDDEDDVNQRQSNF
ncbi:hypothetical protein M8J75_010290 [Diaphorina citri]|nr:hypothetical protein M8J75_010290 [Diaphorina citri]KAI5753054.1 hypothetical protein M8J77_023023 [Diaphorina citri]